MKIGLLSLALLALAVTSPARGTRSENNQANSWRAYWIQLNGKTVVSRGSHTSSLIVLIPERGEQEFVLPDDIGIWRDQIKTTWSSISSGDRIERILIGRGERPVRLYLESESKVDNPDDPPSTADDESEEEREIARVEYNSEMQSKPLRKILIDAVIFGIGAVKRELKVISSDGEHHLIEAFPDTVVVKRDGRDIIWADIKRGDRMADFTVTENGIVAGIELITRDDASAALVSETVWNPKKILVKKSIRVDGGLMKTVTTVKEDVPEAESSERHPSYKIIRDGRVKTVVGSGISIIIIDKYDKEHEGNLSVNSDLRMGSKAIEWWQIDPGDVVVSANIYLAGDFLAAMQIKKASASSTGASVKKRGRGK